MTTWNACTGKNSRIVNSVEIELGNGLNWDKLHIERQRTIDELPNWLSNSMTLGDSVINDGFA